jgi:DNA-directed RNA polymerase subunit RPC12/RpoP
MNTTNDANKKKCNKCKNNKPFCDFHFKTKIGEGLKIKKSNLSYICKTCQKERNKDNYKKKTINCTKCNNKKLIISDPNTFKTSYVCQKCRPTYFMTNSEKIKYYRQKKKSNIYIA